jgi:Tc5 transposase DNA-binding domain
MPYNPSSKRAQSTPKPKQPSSPRKRPLPPAYSEKDIQEAMKACSKSNLSRISAAAAARKYHIPPATLGARMRGQKSRKVAHNSQKLLTPSQEDVLVRYCQNMGWRGEPVGLADIRAMVKEITQQYVGLNWVERFVDRHPELRTRWAKKGESKRGKALNRFNKESYFTALAKAREGIDSDCIWNCDEKGIVENGGAMRRRVVVGSNQTDPKITADESRKTVTILECVSAAGAAIGPLVIHEGAEKDAEWVRSNPCGAQ